MLAREGDTSVAAHIAGLTVLLQNLQQSIVDNSTVNRNTSNAIGQLINQQITLINAVDNTRSEQTLTDIKQALATLPGRLPAGKDYSEAIKDIIGKLDKLGGTLERQTNKIADEIHRTNSRAHVRGGDGVRP